MARRLSSPFSVPPGAAEEAAGADVEGEEREEEEREAMFYRLDQLGFKVGQGLVERFLPPLPPPSSLWGTDGKQVLKGQAEDGGDAGCDQVHL